MSAIESLWSGGVSKLGLWMLPEVDVTGDSQWVAVSLTTLEAQLKAGFGKTFNGNQQLTGGDTTTGITSATSGDCTTTATTDASQTFDTNASGSIDYPFTIPSKGCFTFNCTHGTPITYASSNILVFDDGSSDAVPKESGSFESTLNLSDSPSGCSCPPPNLPADCYGPFDSSGQLYHVANNGSVQVSIDIARSGAQPYVRIQGFASFNVSQGMLEDPNVSNHDSLVVTSTNYISSDASLATIAMTAKTYDSGAEKCDLLTTATPSDTNTVLFTFAGVSANISMRAFHYDAGSDKWCSTFPGTISGSVDYSQGLSAS